MTKAFVPGVFDYLHHGHTNLIDKALELYDQIIVGVIDDEGLILKNKKSKHSTIDRVNTIKEHYPNVTVVTTNSTVEDYIKIYFDHKVDIHVVGTDHKGTPKALELEKHIEVIYLPRTEGISSTQLRNEDPEYNKE